MILFANLALVLQWFVLLIIPDIARPGIFFGVTVAPGFAARPEGRRIRRAYRAALSLCSLATLILLNWAPLASGLQMAAAIHLQVIGSMAAWVWGNRQARPFVQPVETARSASLASRETGLPGGWLFFLGPLFVSGFAAALLGLNWDSIPDPVPVHWNIQGQPNRWAERTVGAVFRPLLVVGFTNILILIMARYTLVHTRQISFQGAAADRERQFKRLSYFIMLFAAYMTSLTGAVLAVRRIGAEPTATLTVWPLLVMPVALMTAVLFYAVRYGQGGVGRTEPTGAILGDHTPDACWKWGMIYYNPDDPAFLVEKRMGYGWTFNFANKWAWVLLLLLLALPFLMRLIR